MIGTILSSINLSNLFKQKTAVIIDKMGNI